MESIPRGGLAQQVSAQPPAGRHLIRYGPVLRRPDIGTDPSTPGFTHRSGQAPVRPYGYARTGRTAPFGRSAPTDRRGALLRQNLLAVDDAVDIVEGDEEHQHQEEGQAGEVDESLLLRGQAFAAAEHLEHHERETAAVERG